MKLSIPTILTILTSTATVLGADKWPSQWCDKECVEAVLFANFCEEGKEIRNCLCSKHFQYKLNKCQSDGCDENYANKNWNETITPLISNSNCNGEYYDGPI